MAEPLHLEVLVEEPSAEAALELLLPRLLDSKISFRIRRFEGKRDLLRKLDSRLRGYARSLRQQDRIVVLVDRDAQSCEGLKGRMEASAQQARLGTLTSPLAGKIQVLNRIAVEELEAWFLGDTEALRAAFPRLPANLGRKSKFRDPDGLSNTWEQLEALLRRSGYYAAGMPKIEVATKVAQAMVPERNRSRSFRVFCSGLERLVAG